MLVKGFIKKGLVALLVLSLVLQTAVIKPVETGAGIVRAPCGDRVIIV
ncbi:MAG: hypothetical protein IJT16_13505 [Lachnospiraceae bacterium]|nr:hypothetical protein [Lachnospiraceae bacterium]